MLLTAIKFTIPRDEVLLRLKYNVKHSQTTEKINQLIDRMMDEGYVLSEPQALVEEYVIQEMHSDEIILRDTTFTLRGKSLVEHLQGCYKVSLLLCTIGNGCANQVKKFLGEKEITNAALLDAVASEAVEAVTEAVNAIINQNAKAEKAETVSRFSTGYGDWSILEQKRIVEVLKGETIGVHVNESSLMVLEKSVSAVVGWKKRT